MALASYTVQWQLGWEVRVADGISQLYCTVAARMGGTCSAAVQESQLITRGSPFPERLPRLLIWRHRFYQTASLAAAEVQAMKYHAV